METVNRKPYISVIITAHNRKEFLKEAIQSALNQTLERSNYEILVIKNF
jgi:glycosyltransferase involved in cell wall biosynthesis